MKKIIITILLTAILLSLAGCSDKGKNNEVGNDNIIEDTNEDKDGDVTNRSSDKNTGIDVNNSDVNTGKEINNSDIDTETDINNSDIRNENADIVSDEENSIERVLNRGDSISGSGGNVSDSDNDNAGKDNKNNDSKEINKDNKSNADNIDSKDNKKNSKDKIAKIDTPKDNSPDTSVKEQKLSELGELSKKLALQMSKRDFKETHDTFSSILKPQLPEITLKQGWDTTVADMGKYKDIREITEVADGNNLIVYIILDYDNSGIQVLFSYNSNKKLDGLWISYAPYEDPVVYDDFEDLAISFGDSKNPIKGILTLPKNVKNPPVVILVHGSGNHDADETIGVNKPFRDLAYGFADHGIAVIRYKESNTTQTKAEFTIQDDSLNDATQAIKYAQGCGKVDKDRIYIVGHSLGGMMAPKIASDNKEVAGIVSLAGSPRKLEDIVHDQNRILLETDQTVTKGMYTIYMAQVNVAVEKIKNLKAGSAEIILGYPASYWYSLNKIDIPKIVQSLDIPIFIAQGSEDFQVYADIDYVAWQEILKDKSNVTFKLYNRLNHLFMTSNGRMDITEYNIKGNIEQKVIDDIAKWILKK